MGSGIDLALGTNASTGFTPPTEDKAFAVLVPELNLTYIDVLATASGK